MFRHLGPLRAPQQFFPSLLGVTIGTVNVLADAPRLQDQQAKSSISDSFL